VQPLALLQKLLGFLLQPQQTNQHFFSVMKKLEQIMQQLFLQTEKIFQHLLE